jgi:chromosome segregation ATPase
VSELEDLGQLLRAAIGEGAPREGAIEAFVEALRERGEVLLRSRVEELDRELLACRERTSALEAERDWQAATIALQLADLERLRGEHTQLESLREDATRAHEKLLAHHSELVARYARELSRLAAALREDPEAAAAALARLAADLGGSDA